MDGKKAAANMWDGAKHCYTAIIYTHPTINATAIHTLCKRPQHNVVCAFKTTAALLVFHEVL